MSGTGPWREPDRRSGPGGAIVIGLALIAVGVLLTLDNLELLDAGAVLAGWWPVVVVLAGVSWAVTGAPIAGGSVVVAGLVLLAATLELLAITPGRVVLPGLLLAFGGALLQAGAGVRGAVLPAGQHPDATGEGVVTVPAATAVFGDVHLTVSSVGAGPGDRVPVTATAVFGDVRILIPSGWRVEDRLTRILGEVRLPAATPTEPTAPVVVLHGVVLFGEVRVAVGGPAGARR